MPYNPGITDISGQLLGRGMEAAAQARAQGMGSITDAVTNVIGAFTKAEQERQQTVGAIQGFLRDPYFQKQIADDPNLATSAQKIQAGNAKLGDVKQFLGSLTTMSHVREMSDKSAQAEAQKLYTDALQKQAIANEAATRAANEERTRNNLIQNQFLMTVKELQGMDKLIDSGKELTAEQDARYQQLAQNPFVTTARKGMEAGLDPITAIRFGQSEEAQQARRAHEDAMRELAGSKEETARVRAELAANKNVKYNAGDERVFTIDGKKITAEYDGKQFIDKFSGAPIYIEEMNRDAAGNVVSTKGVLNPQIARQYGFSGGSQKSEASSPQINVPGLTNSRPPESQSTQYEEVPAPQSTLTSGETKSYKTEEEAAQAWREGKLKFGERVIVNGQSGTWKL